MHFRMTFKEIRELFFNISQKTREIGKNYLKNSWNPLKITTTIFFCEIAIFWIIFLPEPMTKTAQPRPKWRTKWSSFWFESQFGKLFIFNYFNRTFLDQKLTPKNHGENLWWVQDQALNAHVNSQDGVCSFMWVLHIRDGNANAGKPAFCAPYAGKFTC